MPAGSLPNDDKVLAHLSCSKKWKKVKDGAMRGWILCSDNRFYHPVVSEKALEALPMRLEYKEKNASDNERKVRERKARKDMFEVLAKHGIAPEWNIPMKELRKLTAPYMQMPVTGNVTDDVTDDVTDSHVTVTAKTETVTGTGTVKGQGQVLTTKDKNSTPEESAETKLPSSPDGDTDLFEQENIATDDKAIAFASGVPALVKLGMADKAARGMVGKAIKEAGEEAAVRICGRLATFENHPNPAALIMALIGEEKDPIFQALRERHGECRKLADGRYQSGSRYFDRDGKQEVSL